MIATQNHWLRLFLFVALIAAVSSTGGQPVGKSAAQLDEQSPRQQAAQGASRCIVCHRAEVDGYARSSMAHSLRRAGREPDGTVSAGDSKIIIYSSPAGSFQRLEHAGDSSTYRIDYVIGSGNHASGYLADMGGDLFQSPVAYYKSRHAYDLAPGYENLPDPDFTRPVQEECVLCHSGTALHVSGTLSRYQPPVFPAEAITCERCHGPVEKHLEDPRAGTIINPAKLEPVARDSVCEQCHLFGAARVPNPGKKLSDFIPGQRLEDTFSTYRDLQPEGSFKVISQVEQLALSACARNSGGRLWCGTCHDPHDKPLQPAQFYRSRCLSCHTRNFPASHPSVDSDCLQCHMPRRDAKDGGHSAFTDHRIQRRPQTEPDLPAAAGLAAWRDPSPDLQQRNLGIAYVEVGLQRRSPDFLIQGYRTLTEVQQQFANDSEVFRWIGEALLLGKQTSEAAIALERALKLDPGSAIAEASAAAPYIQGGDADRAIEHLERAVTLDPMDLPTAIALIDLYQKHGNVTEAAELSGKIKLAMSQAPDVNGSEQQVSASDSSKRAEEVYKNIRVLKGVPSGQLIPAMQFISSSLGVQCSFCHVEGHYDRDDKKPKQTARDMMQMMFALNQKNFAGQREVTCYSCHRGALNPVATPVVGSQAPPDSGAAESAKQKLPADLPTARQLIDNYIQALGGALAIEKITSRVETAAADFRGQSIAVEVFTQSPAKQAVVRHLPEGESVTAFDGHAGWVASPGHPTREMLDADLAAVQMDADLHFPLHIRQLFPELRVEYPEKIEGREADVLLAKRQGQPPVKFYFDRQSSLLVRLVRYADSPLGLDPSRIDYADYRDVDGVQVPFRVTVSQPGSTSTTEVKDVHQNVPIDEAKFAKPAADRSLTARH
jgi:photosynthetic reaction center cytochrome c subunit